MAMSKEEKIGRASGLVLAIADYILGYAGMKPFIGQIVFVLFIVLYIAKFRRKLVSHIFFSYLISFIGIVLIMLVLGKVLGKPEFLIF